MNEQLKELEEHMAPYTIPARYSGTMASNTVSLSGSYKIREWICFISFSSPERSSNGSMDDTPGFWESMETKLV